MRLMPLRFNGRRNITVKNLSVMRSRTARFRSRTPGTSHSMVCGSGTSLMVP